jgi:hypothetical protein
MKFLLPTALAILFFPVVVLWVIAVRIAFYIQCRQK